MRSRAPQPRPRRAAGFSVLELVVAAAILGVAMLIAARLLQDVGMQIAWSGRKTLELSPSLALEQLRTDLRNSQGTGDALGMWQSPPLAVQRSSTEYTIVYDIEDRKLLRRTIAPSGRRTERVLLDQVVDLRYRTSHDAVEIEVEFLRMQPPLRRDEAAGMREAGSPERHKMGIVVLPRRMDTESF